MDEIERLMSQVLDTNVETSRNAIFALERLGDPRAVPAICNALRVHPSRYVRVAAAGALGKFCDPYAIPSLTGALEDDNYDTRWLAVVALGAIGPSALMDALDVVPEGILENLEEGS